MTALKRAPEIDRFLQSPNPASVVVLIYGPDFGLVSERVKTLVKNIAGSLDDPFSIVRLSEKDLSGDPGRLLDEANAMTFGGSRRVVWIDDAGQSTARALDNITGAETSSIVIVSAGNLKPTAKLRKFAEAKKCAIAIPCYADDTASLNSVLDAELKKYDLTITQDARHFFVGLLGADRQLSRREIEKLCLYAAKNKEITSDDVRMISGDATTPTLDMLCDAVAEGNVDQADKVYARSLSAGTNPNAVIIQMIRHFIMLDWFASQSQQKGGEARSYVKQYRPPVFFKRQRSVEHQTGLWSHEHLKSALGLLHQAESQCRSTHLPTEAIAERALISLAMSAKRRQRRY